MFAEAYNKVKFTVSIKNIFEFHRLYSKGKSAGSALMVVYCRKTKRCANRLGITVSKKLGNAVLRNKIRRRIREIYRTNEDELLSGFDLVIVARRGSTQAAYRELEADFLRLADRLGFRAGGLQ